MQTLISPRMATQRSIAWLAGAMLGVATLTALPAAAADDLTPPDVLAERTANELIDELKARKSEFESNQKKLNAAVERIVLPHFDTKYVSALVLAREWRSASKEQRTRFEEAFITQLVNFYGNALLDYSDQSIRWSPLEVSADAKDVTVRSQIVESSGSAVPINYSVHLREGRWQVYDVTVEGISLVTNYRGQFAAEIRRNGLEALITRLESERTALAS